MQCRACGAGVVDDAVYCTACGAHLEIACAACGATSPPGAKFCKQCGEGLAQPGLRPEAYVPAHLREKILAGRAQLAGELKQVTVLFADVRGSMELQERLPAEDWRRIMEGFFHVLADGVHAYEGTVTQFTGDGIMALFGAPIAHEDHAQRACHAALHVQTHVQRYAKELRETHGLEFTVRLGLNSGEVAVGGIGDDLTMEYTALGHTVGLAQRMEAAATPGTVYLSEHTARLVFGFFALSDMGAQAIKGVEAPLRVFELRGVGPAHTRLDIARTRGLSKFVGRDAEMRVLHDALARTREGQGCVVGVVALPGTGKSRLCYEFVAHCRADGLPVHEAHGLAHGMKSAYLPMLEFLRNFFGITDQDSAEVARQRIRNVLRAIDPELEAPMPILFEFLGVGDPAQPVQQIDPQARQRQLFAVVQRVTQGARQPEVIWLEDLHWFDEASRGMLNALVEAVPGSRALLLVSFRPEFEADWMHRTAYEQIALHPLRPEASTELLGDLLGRDPSLNGVPQLIRDRTGGNPFFIEEVVQDLAEHGSLAGERGAYTLTRSIEELTVPASVQAVLDARIDRLPEGAKHVLQTAAVIGRTFPEPVLERVVEDVGELPAALRALGAMEFLYKTGAFPEAEYTFKHALTQEVAYHSQLTDRRHRTHIAVAEAIEAFYPDDLDERAAVIAHHYEQAGANLLAAQWHRRAALWSGPGDPAASFRHWRQIRALLVDTSPSQETLRLRLEACFRLLYWMWRMGPVNLEEAARWFAEGKALAEQVHDLPTLILLHGSYGHTCGRGGDLQQYRRIIQDSTRLVAQAGDPALEATNGVHRTWSAYCGGRLREALTCAERTIEVTRDDPTLGSEHVVFCPHIFCRQLRGALLAHAGRFPEAVAAVERAIELAEAYEDVENLHWSESTAAFVCGMAGDAARATEHARRSIQINDEIGSTISRTHARQHGGRAYLAAENWFEAERLLQQALTDIRTTGTGRLIEAEVLGMLGEAYLGRQLYSRARETAEEAITLARAQGAKSQECEATLTWARVVVRADGAAAGSEVTRALRRAEALAKETGFTALKPHIGIERAELARLTGKMETWDQELREAHRLFTEMGAPIRAQQVEALLQGVA